jgi:competence ComEA-like helix-hairpin-helix protein
MEELVAEESRVELLETNKPGTNKPETEKPWTEIPEAEIPEAEIPVGEPPAAGNPLADGEQQSVGKEAFCMPSACNLLLGLLCLLAAVRLIPLGLATLFEPVPNIAPPRLPVFRVDINTATLAEFQALPEIGPALAQRIVEYRTERGGFRTIDELQEVQGFGPKRLENLRPLISVQPAVETTASSLTLIHGQLNAN